MDKEEENGTCWPKIVAVFSLAATSEDLAAAAEAAEGFATARGERRKAPGASGNGARNASDGARPDDLLEAGIREAVAVLEGGRGWPVSAIAIKRHMAVDRNDHGRINRAIEDMAARNVLVWTSGTGARGSFILP